MNKMGLFKVITGWIFLFFGSIGFSTSVVYSIFTVWGIVPTSYSLGYVFGQFIAMALIPMFLLFWGLWFLKKPFPENNNPIIVSTLIFLVLGMFFGYSMYVGETILNDEYEYYDYEQIDYKTPVPIVQYERAEIVPAKMMLTYNNYGFSFKYLSDMDISEEGSLSEEANEDSGMIYVTKGIDEEGYFTGEEVFKAISVEWLSTTDLELFSFEDVLKEYMDFLSDYREEGYIKITDLSKGEEIQTTKSGHSVLFQELVFRNYGVKEYAIHGCWYCESNQKMFYVFVETYDKKETDELFNEFLDSFVCHSS